MDDNHTVEDHITKMQHDCGLAQQLAEGEEYYDWTITCTFYFAVHCIEAYAHKHHLEQLLENTHPSRNESLHLIRQRFVNNYLPNFFSIYMRLYEKSRNSRYDPTYFKKISKLKGYHKRLLEAALKMKTILK